MGDVINLRRARKAKQRQEGEQRAAQTRALHGRTKAERAATAAETNRFERHIEQSRREVEPPKSAAILTNDPDSTH